MPVGQNGRKTMAIIEYTYEVAVPYALFIFEGTELYGVRLCMSSSNNNPPPFYVSKDAVNDIPVPTPFDNFNSRHKTFDNFNARHEPHPQMMMNISESSFSSEPNFDALLQMGQNMLIPPPMGFDVMPMNMPMTLFSLHTNDLRNQIRTDYQDHGRDMHRDQDRSYDREQRDRDHSRRQYDGGRHKPRHRKR